MKELKLLAISVMSILAPIKSVLITTLFMVLVDLVLGIIAAKKRGESITSAGMRRSISKIFVYEIGIIMAFVTEKYLTGDLAPVEKIVAAFVGLTELTSIVENLNEISGGSLLAALVQKLGSQNIDK